MATNLKLKRSAVADKSPTTAQLELGEIAINTNDGKLFFKKDNGLESIITLQEVTEDNIVIDPSGLNFSTSTTLSEVLDDIDQAIYDVNAAAGLSEVTHDTTLTGLGTQASPLGVNYTTLDGRYLQAEADTLQSVTDRGASTTNEITVPSLEIGDVANEAGARFSWNAIDGTLDMAYDGVTLQVGQEQHFYAKASEAISNGEAVMFAGVQGDHILVRKVDVTVPGFIEDWVIGVATQDIAENAYGYVTSFGYVRELDTATNWSAGEILWIDPTTPGALTNVKPAAPNKAILLAAVAREHATEGTIFVRLSYRSGLVDLHDVNITNAQDGDLITWNNTAGTWDSTSTPTLDYIDIASGSAPSYQEGRVFYDNAQKALSLYVEEADVTLQIGREEWVRAYNATGSTIPNGTPVYGLGVDGFGRPLIAPADATSADKANVIGIATHDIEDSSFGYCTVRGVVSGIDTSALTAGQPIHVGPNGELQSSAPTYPYFSTDIGGCLYVDSTNGAIYVRIIQHYTETLRTTGNTHMGGDLYVEGNFVVSGTQTITNEANLSISDSFIYLNSGDTIGEAGTTFTGTGLDDAYFSNHYEGTTTETYYVRIDGVGTGTGGVDTYEWSKDNFTTTEATGVDLATETLLDNNLCIHFNALTGHTLGDTWSGTAAPVNIDTGWFTNYNTGTSGVGYTHAGVFMDVTDGHKFKFVSEYSPEPSGNIDTGDASFTLGTVVASSFEGTATNASQLNNQDPSYYLDYTNATNKPTIGNGTITVSAGDGLGTGGSFTLNATSNSTVTLTNTDKGSSQNIFKSFSVSGQDSVFADSNTEDLEFVAGSNVTITTNDTNKTISIASTDTNDNDYLTALSFDTSTGVLTATVQNQSDVTVDLDDRYVLITDNPTSITEDTVATVNPTVVDSFDGSVYRTAKYLVQATHGTDYQVTEILLIHNGTTTFVTEYGTVVTNATLATFDANYNAGSVELVCTAVNTNTDIVVHRLNLGV